MADEFVIAIVCGLIFEKADEDSDGFLFEPDDFPQSDSSSLTVSWKKAE